MKLPILPKLNQLEAADFFIEDEKLFQNKQFSGGDYSFETAHNLVLSQCHLEKITMQKSRLERFEAANVVFDHCDFSNLEWIGGSFHQVKFHQCKLIGTNFAESYLHNCTFVDCIADLSSFSGANLKAVHFKDCQLHDSDFFNVQWKNLTFLASDLTRSNWMRTKMQDLDLSQAHFEQIFLTTDDLKGLIVNTEQALIVSMGLGLKITD